MNITQFSHIGSQGGFFFSFFFFFTFEAQYFTLVTIFSRMSTVVGQKRWFNWYKNIKRKNFKKEQLHDRYLHIPCTTEVKQKGQRSFQHKSYSSGICNNLHNTLCHFHNPIMLMYLDSFCKWQKKKKVCKVHWQVACI